MIRSIQLTVIFLLHSLVCLAQPDQQLVDNFRKAKSTVLDEHLVAEKPLKFDFRVVSSRYFEQESLDKDFYINDPKPVFQLIADDGDSMQLAFDCLDKNLERE